MPHSTCSAPRSISLGTRRSRACRLAPTRQACSRPIRALELLFTALLISTAAPPITAAATLPPLDPAPSTSCLRFDFSTFQRFDVPFRLSTFDFRLSTFDFPPLRRSVAPSLRRSLLFPVPWSLVFVSTFRHFDVSTFRRSISTFDFRLSTFPPSSLRRFVALFCSPFPGLCFDVSTFRRFSPSSLRRSVASSLSSVPRSLAFVSTFRRFAVSPLRCFVAPSLRRSLLFPCLSFRRFPPADDPRTALTRNVATIAAPGIPGPLALTGDNAFVVAVGGVTAAKSGLRAPVVAAATLGRGRIVAFGHTGYLDAPTLNVADTAALIDNALRWSAGRTAGDPSDPPPLRIGLLGLDGFAPPLKQRGHNTIKIVANDLPSRLTDLEVLCLSHAPLTPAHEAAVQRFVSDGGGLLISGLGWGWLQLNPGKTLADHPGNRLLAPAGIAFNDGYLSRTAPDGFAVGVSAADSEPLIPLCHAAAALDLLAAAPPNEQNNDNSRQLQQAAWTITEVIRLLPSEKSPLRRRLDRLAARNPADLIPTPQQPIGMDQPLKRVLVAWEFDRASRRPPAKVTRAAAAAQFPGDVPPDARSVTRDIDIDPRVPAWHSTGLYAPPGGLIVVTVPPEAAAQGWSIRIGAHTDRLWSNDPWRRSPEISRASPIRTERTEAVNPFGGLIYIDLPNPPAGHGAQPPPAVNGAPPPATASSPAPHIRVRISGAVEAPWFVLGRTSPDEWRQRLRRLPAPWAELQTSKIIITVPARVVRSLDDPEPLLRFWDRIADAHATLAAIPLDRLRPERFVADEQISAGYMHAGYPIMTHLDVAELFVSLDRLKRGDMWGFLHELGHNHQHPDWTFDGTGEVTCNLFALHALETICDLPPGTRGHNAVDAPPPLTDYLTGGPDFEKWKRDPFLALRMYIQMKDAFGWDIFRQVFAEYRALPAADRPRSDDEKRDQWLIRFSRAAGRNLGPFFQAWGVPTSESARRAVADLPSWMPPDWPTQPTVSP